MSEQVVKNTQQGTNNEDLETSKLIKPISENALKLQKAHSYSASNGPTTNALTTSSPSTLITQQSLGYPSSKPTLIRQDRATSSYLASPQLSTLGTSEDTSDDNSIVYHLMTNLPPTNTTTNRCRSCHLNERRSSVSPSSVIHMMPRSTSKESLFGRYSPNSLQYSSIPPVLVTGGSPSRTSQLPRQSSQPESTTHSCCAVTHAQQTSSLRQLKDASDPIAGIATETLRVSS